MNNQEALDRFRKLAPTASKTDLREACDLMQLAIEGPVRKRFKDVGKATSRLAKLLDEIGVVPLSRLDDSPPPPSRQALESGDGRHAYIYLAYVVAKLLKGKPLPESPAPLFSIVDFMSDPNFVGKVMTAPAGKVQP